VKLYVDASVLLRVILGEPDPLADWASAVPLSSELIRVECLRVIDRARIVLAVSDMQTARHRSDVLEALGAFRLAPVTTTVLDRAAEPFPTALSSLDAIHLATALQLRDDIPDLLVATHDRELAVAAQAVGFTVLGAG
jgi:predicted nucleic acid-binding protein